MQVILSNQCESLTGSLGRGFGYFIQRRSNKRGQVHYFSQRSKHGKIPADGHLRFILACAEIAKNTLHITDIKVDWMELMGALEEAHKFIPAQNVHDNFHGKGKEMYNAQDIINLKFTFSL